MDHLVESALRSNAWPFQEARAILKKLNNKLPEKGYVLFETGYGPSGLPHIGTFGEVLRTTIVRKAFSMISDMPTKLFCISDDMDGMRKIPDNIPNAEEYTQYLDLPLTSIPDPFGTHENYGAHMNARLRSFLDFFNFDYEFKSATECYKSGEFNEALIKVLEHYDAIMNIMLPTLGEERRATYSPFLPICPETGKVLITSILATDHSTGTITYKNSKGDLITTEVTDGKCKLQWKPDFGMRWAAFDVDFEMYGKDHLVNGPIYTKICKAIGGKAPHQSYYELFLDAKGNKISKSKGNGITLNEWLHYAPQNSLSLFMYQSPKRAKRLYLDIIPKSVDEYLTFLRKYHKEEDAKKKIDNPVFHIHGGKPPVTNINISYSLLLNLVSVCNTHDPKVIWGYLSQFDQSIVPGTSEVLDNMVEKSINYYNDFIKPNKKFRTPEGEELQAISKLVQILKDMEGKESEEIQAQVYTIGKEFGFVLKEWFQCLYEVMLGSPQGPRLGTFIKLYGVKETINLLESKIAQAA